MKTIKEKAREYSFNMYDKNLDIITQIESAFKNGYELCKSEWQEKVKKLLNTNNNE